MKFPDERKMEQEIICVDLHKNNYSCQINVSINALIN